MGHGDSNTEKRTTHTIVSWLNPTYIHYWAEPSLARVMASYLLPLPDTVMTCWQMTDMNKIQPIWNQITKNLFGNRCLMVLSGKWGLLFWSVLVLKLISEYLQMLAKFYDEQTEIVFNARFLHILQDYFTAAWAIISYSCTREVTLTSMGDLINKSGRNCYITTKIKHKTFAHFRGCLAYHHDSFSILIWAWAI